MVRSMPLIELVDRKSWRRLIMCAAIALVWFAARAAELDGVQLPDPVQVDGTSLHLNGFGLRTYSLLGIHIYVAGLYLEHLSTDPDEIIRSPDTKLLTVRFERSVSADAARKAWRDGLEHNCKAPCRLDPEDVERFLAMVPAMHAGDSYTLLFRQHIAIVAVSGHQIGVISQPQFADAMLATFLGPHPASPKLKQELLQGHG
jgi:Chalcone isomerase-like